MVALDDGTGIIKIDDDNLRKVYADALSAYTASITML